MTVRIIVADDHPVTRKGLSSVLENIDNFQIVAETGDGLSTVKAALLHKPDVIIMDISMPNMNGLEATRSIHEKNKQIKIIALSIHSNKHYVQEMF
ncbi:MAG: response regulator transcription factor, partial [Aminobacterium sp.]|nr:response regulator transcription factor [Aminobacterium sp.]